MKFKAALASLGAVAALAAGVAVPASAAPAPAQAALPGGVIQHHRNSAQQYLGVLNHWPYAYATYQTRYSTMKAAGAQPWMLARGDRTPYTSDTDGFWVPPGYWAGKVTGLFNDRVEWLTNGGSIGRAMKITSNTNLTIILCTYAQDGRMCLNGEYWS